MQINVNKEIFMKSIITADSVISSKNVNTILSNCLFNVLKDEIEILSTDNEIAVRTRIEAVSDSAFSFAANGKKLSAIIKELPDNEISMNLNEENRMLDIKSKNVKGHYNLITSETEEFPEIPEINTKDYIEVEQGVLKEILKKVNYAASPDTIKPVFNGIFFQIENNRLIAVATDSRRLSVISRQFETDYDLAEGIIIPLKTVNEVLKLLDTKGKCRFSYNNNQCFFEIGNSEIISRIVGGQFPNYKQVIPQEHSRSVIVETRKILDSARRAMIFTREPSNKIIMHFNKDTLLMEANTPEYGVSEEEVAIETSGSDDKISLGLNVQFLIDALKEIDSYSIKCGITGQMSPLTITPEDDPDYLSVIMPLQIKTGSE